LFLGLRKVTGELGTQVQVLQTAYTSSQKELGDLEPAAVEACQAIDEGTSLSGSSVESCLRALSGHAVEHMKGIFRLDIQKALGVVTMHYVVDLAALATGYIVEDDLDDDGAQEAVERVDAAAPDTAAELADAFEEDLLPYAPPAGAPEP
jgi:hypothetical protein